MSIFCLLTKLPLNPPPDFSRNISLFFKPARPHLFVSFLSYPLSGSASVQLSFLSTLASFCAHLVASTQLLLPRHYPLAAALLPNPIRISFWYLTDKRQTKPNQLGLQSTLLLGPHTHILRGLVTARSFANSRASPCF